MEQQLLKISEQMQLSIEGTFVNEPSGICYLTGHCMNEVLSKLGYNCRKVTGKLALMSRNGKKYIVYGKLNGIQVGDYHTWCEVEYEGKAYIIDPSLKYNLKFLSLNKIEISKSIPEIIISTEKNTYNWKYIEDSSLERHSISYLNKIAPEAIETIISDCLRQ